MKTKRITMSLEFSPIGLIIGGLTGLLAGTIVFGVVLFGDSEIKYPPCSESPPPCVAARWEGSPLQRVR